MPKYRLSVDETRNTLNYVDIETSLNETELDALLSKIENNNEIVSTDALIRKLEGYNVKVKGIDLGGQAYYTEAKTLEIEELKEPKKQDFMIQCKACVLKQEDIEQAREEMIVSIEKNRIQTSMIIQLSRMLDTLIVAQMGK